jgi:hypothetical protein
MSRTKSHGSRGGDEGRPSVEESRREVERRLGELRESIGREIGIRPKAKPALIALAAASAGFALAAGRRRRKKRQKRR